MALQDKNYCKSAGHEPSFSLGLTIFCNEVWSRAPCDSFSCHCVSQPHLSSPLFSLALTPPPPPLRWS